MPSRGYGLVDSDKGNVVSGSGVSEGFAHHLAGRRVEAEAVCGALLEQDPNDAGALHLLSVMAHSQNRLGPALKLVRMALAAAPTFAGYHNTHGIILSDLHYWEESFAAFTKATDLDPACFDAYRNLAVALSKATRLDEAVAAARACGPASAGRRRAIGTAGLAPPPAAGFARRTRLPA